MRLFEELLQLILNLSSLFKDDFGEWIKTASDEELKTAYEERRLTDFKRTGVKTPEMERLDKELYRRYTEDWEKKHPSNGPHERWTDKNRWEKD